MATQAQIDANRVNARHSTGPRTEEGKARSSRNALKHGLNSTEFFVRGDEQEDFAALRDSLAEEILPKTAIERQLFHNALHAAWSLHRVRRMEADLLGASPDPLSDPDLRSRIDLLARYQSRAERSYYRATEELRRHSTNLALRETIPVQERKGASQLLDPQQFQRTVNAYRRAWKDADPDIWIDPDNPPPPEPPVQWTVINGMPALVRQDRRPASGA